ncbi:hypothetical protein [Microbacterium sp.]|uniref:hypothetical protein n=1 Tax=Microbacterium sp. TaxID=51671 RepID=UPI003340051D
MTDQIAFHVRHAGFDAGDGSDPRARAQKVLAGLRVLAALRDGAEDPNEDGVEAVALIPMTEDGRIVTLGDDDRLSFALRASELREAFVAAGLTLWLFDEDEEAAASSEGAFAHEDDDEAPTADVRDVDDAFDRADVDPADEDGLFFAPQPVRVAEFSHRARWAARAAAELTGAEVEYVEQGVWSMVRYETAEPHMTLAGTRSDGAIIELNVAGVDDAWLEVTLPSGAVHVFWPNSERGTIPVLNPASIIEPASAEVYRRMLTESDGVRDELAEIARVHRVDVERAAKASMPEALGGVVGAEERLSSFVGAFGVPDGLIADALSAEPVGRRFTPQGWPAAIGETLVDGLEGLSSLTRRDRPFARWERALRTRPFLAAAAHTAELTVGVAALRSRSRLGKAFGVLLVIEAVADLVIWVVRMRRSR